MVVKSLTFKTFFAYIIFSLLHKNAAKKRSVSNKNYAYKAENPEMVNIQEMCAFGVLMWVVGR